VRNILNLPGSSSSAVQKAVFENRKYGIGENEQTINYGAVRQVGVNTDERKLLETHSNVTGKKIIRLEKNAKNTRKLFKVEITRSCFSHWLITLNFIRKLLEYDLVLVYC